MKIFSGTANPILTKNVCKNLNIPMGAIYHKRFPSGECYCQFKENIRGSDVFIIQPIAAPANDNFMELCLMADAARRASAERITAVIPFMGYSRQDRKDKSRVPISAKMVMDMLQCAGFNRFLMMDLHAAQIGGFTNLPVDHLTFKPSLIAALKESNTKIDVVVAPDIGAVKRATDFANSLDVDMAIISKKRLGDTKVEVQNFIGDVAGKNVLIVDDLTESVGTLVEAAKACRKQGADKINVAITHACFSDVGIRNRDDALLHRVFNHMFYSNTVSVPFSPDTYGSVTQVDVSSVFATAIHRIHCNESVSELFAI